MDSTFEWVLLSGVDDAAYPDRRALAEPLPTLSGMRSRSPWSSRDVLTAANHDFGIVSTCYEDKVVDISVVTRHCRWKQHQRGCLDSTATPNLRVAENYVARGRKSCSSGAAVRESRSKRFNMECIPETGARRPCRCPTGMQLVPTALFINFRVGVVYCQTFCYSKTHLQVRVIGQLCYWPIGVWKWLVVGLRFREAHI
jgi:hypothetical protein